MRPNSAAHLQRLHSTRDFRMTTTKAHSATAKEAPTEYSNIHKRTLTEQTNAAGYARNELGAVKHAKQALSKN